MMNGKKRDSQVANKSKIAVGAVLEHLGAYRTRHMKTRAMVNLLSELSMKAVSSKQR